MGFARLRDVRDRDRPRRWSGATTTESRLFEAAELALAEHGYAGLRVQDLCDYAEIGRSAFYHYFSSASAVVVAMLARAIDDIYDECAEFLRPSAPPADRGQIEGGLRAGWSAWDRHRVVFMATSQHWPDVPELRDLWTELVGRFTGALAHAIDQARAVGEAPTGLDSAQLAALLVWSVERHAFVSGMEIDPRLADSGESVIDAVCELWRQAIYGQSAGESPADR
jgi:AcrR family transcriptional regulator